MSKIKSLSEKAMIVDLTIGYWQGRKKDQDVSFQVTQQAEASSDSGAWWSQLIPRDELKPIRQAMGYGRKTHFEFSLPWMDNGQRVLPATAYMDYMQDMRMLKEQYVEAVEEFILRYPKLVEKACDRLGKLFKPDVYPDASELRSKFYWSINVFPLPDSKDFRVELQDKEIEKAKAQIETEVDRRMEIAMQDLWKRLYDTVSKAAESLSDPDKKFRNSLIENLVSVCDILPKLNIMEDPKLDEMKEIVMDKVANESAEVLRRDPKKRSKSAKEARKLVKEMDAIFG